MITVKKLVVGPLRTNCYILIHEDEAIIVDPGGNHDKILDAIKNLKIRAIVATHGHFDHVLGVPYLKRKLGAPFMLHKSDLETLELFGSYMLNETPKPDSFLEEGDTIYLGSKRIEIIHTPGHTPGSICMYIYEDQILLTGDTLFRGAYGRTDLPGGDPQKIFGSLRKIFTMFSDNFRVLPGHGEETTIGSEKRYYKYLLT